jgi:nitrogen fixation protein
MQAINLVWIYRTHQRQSSYIHKKGIEEIINIQPKGNKGKTYQVAQVRDLVLKYKLQGGTHVQI